MLRPSEEHKLHTAAEMFTLVLRAMHRAPEYNAKTAEPQQENETDER